MNTQLKTALEFAQLNFKVFPLKFNTKSGQLLKSWKNEASSKIDQLKEWFQESNNNIGILTGKGLVVIDVDCKKSDAGLKTIKKVSKHFPATYTVQTPSGGFHIYYLVDCPFRNKVRLYDEIDIRGEDGYVVGAGSIIDGKEYKVIQERSIACANLAVYSFLEGKHSFLDGVASTIQIGTRNDTLFKIGCSLLNKGATKDEIRNELFMINENQCEVPLESHEVNCIIDSIMTYQKGGAVDVVDKSERLTAVTLLATKMMDEQDIVEGMISIGLTLLAAPQKCGKTFLALQLANAIVTGTKFLDRDVHQGTALYLAFEDKKLKMKKRFQTMKLTSSDQLVIDFVAPNSNYNLEQRIKQEVEINPNLRIVIVDTFAKMRNTREHDYETEYAEATQYHNLAYKYKIAIVLVTHVRKEINYNQPFDAIYGSRGLPAGSDNIIVMYKKHHTSSTRYLAFQGKDIEDGEMTLLFTDQCLFTQAEDEIDDDIDENLSRVINYIIRKRMYEGSHDELCSILNLQLQGRGLQALLKKNLKTLSDSYISYTSLPRTRKARPIKLEYYGDDEQ